MDTLNCMTKLILNWFEFVSFRFGMRENLSGVGADQAYAVKLSCVRAVGLY